MKIYSTYSVKIKHYNRIFAQTAALYRGALDWYIDVVLNEWETFKSIDGSKARMATVERLTVKTKAHPSPKYDFGEEYYKFPTYLRRAAINDAFGKVSSYQSNLANGLDAKPPKAGYSYPAMYRDGMFVRTGTYTARIKVYIHNTWDWLDVELKKSDVDYILHHCQDRSECVPTLAKRGKEWFLDFAFTEKAALNDTPVTDRRALAVDLGINNACTCSVMTSDGTILGREFLKLTREQDSLTHVLNRIKKAQQHGACKTPRLWARANGINNDIAVKTANFIMDVARQYNADVIVFEHLDHNGKIYGSNKQRLQLWKAQYVQSMVTDKAHRLGMRISHVNIWNTSKLAFDGSGCVERGRYTQNGVRCYNYSICTFASGKQYNCDLNASYNIGARYFIRELLKSVPETSRLALEAKVPSAAKRSTCTLSTLINLNAELVDSMAA